MKVIGGPGEVLLEDGHGGLGVRVEGVVVVTSVATDSIYHGCCERLLLIESHVFLYTIQCLQGEVPAVYRTAVPDIAPKHG